MGLSFLGKPSVNFLSTTCRIYLEAFLEGRSTPEELTQIRTRMGEILEGRNLERALAGLARIESGKNDK